MTARCPFCGAILPVVVPDPVGRHVDCPCGVTPLLCAPGQEPGTAVWLSELGLSDSYADVLDETLSIVWGRERRWWASRA